MAVINLAMYTLTRFPADFVPIALTLQRGVTGTARMLHALTHSSISRQVREQR